MDWRKIGRWYNRYHLWYFVRNESDQLMEDAVCSYSDLM